jgi:hypothetical protein
VPSGEVTRSRSPRQTLAGQLCHPWEGEPWPAAGSGPAAQRTPGARHEGVISVHDDLLTRTDIDDQEAYRREWLAERADADAIELEGRAA